MFPLHEAHSSYDDTLTYADDTIVLFCKPQYAFSQRTLSPFTVDGANYNCAEQYIMISKACLFNDREALIPIMASSDPQAQKRLGRHVRSFDEHIWLAERDSIVLQGTLAKFSQTLAIRDALM